MPVFSFTAPAISEEEEKAEREALSVEERKQVHDDLFGTEDKDDDVPETTEMLENCLNLFREALEQIPDNSKQEYLEAMERAPEVVRQETDPVAFLRSQHYDAWSAAARLVAYWEIRKQIFGPDRFVLPMTLDGAMADSAEAFSKGTIMILPDDRKGRAVVYCDRIRAVVRSIVSREEFFCCFFYVLHVMLERNSVQKRGYVGLINCKVRSLS
jgi:hypothetical protein